MMGMAKAEIGWTRTTDEGVKLDCYAQHVGDRWIFYQRERRYEQWQRIEEPPLEDWMELLDAVKTRPQAYVLCAGALYTVVRTLSIPFRGARRVAAVEGHGLTGAAISGAPKIL